MATFTWNSGTSAKWSQATDWTSTSETSGTAIPGTDDTAVLDAGSITLDIAATIQGLVEEGGSGAALLLTSLHDITVTGAASFAGTVEQTGNAATDLLGSSTLGAAGAPATLWLDGGHVLKNAGSFALTDGEIVLGALPGGGSGGGEIVNAGSSTFEISATGTVIEAGTGATGVGNSGTLLYDGSGEAVITAQVNNGGKIQVASGTLALLGGVNSSGAGLAIEAGAELDIGSAGLTITRGSFTGPGTLVITGGLANLAQALLNDPLGTIVTQSGTLFIVDHAAHLGTLVQTATADTASLVTSQYLLSLSTLDVSGVAVYSGTGATTVAQSATIGAAPDGSTTAIYLDGGRKLVNRGTMLVGAGAIVLGATPLGTALGGAKLANMATGLLDFADGTSVVAGTGTISFTSSGTITKLTGSGTTSIGVALTSSGSIYVADGMLAFDAGGKAFARNITVDSGGTIGFGGGTFTLVSGSFDLNGAMAVAGGLVDMTHIVAISTGGLVLSGGTLSLGVRSVTAGSLTESGLFNTLTGSGVVTVTGSATLGGIALETGIGDTVLAGGGTLLAGALLDLDGRRMLENAGTLLAQGGEIMLGARPSGAAEGSGEFVNDATGALDITADGTAVAGGAGYTNLSNMGYLGKTGGSGVTAITASMVNNGTVEAASGTLALGIAAGTGVFEIDNACVLEFTSAMQSGTIDFIGSAGTLALDQPAAFGGSITGFGTGSVIDLAGVTATPTLAYTGTSAGGTLTVTGGGVTASLLFNGDLTTYNFTTASDGHGGVLIS
jgi:hypothetical protein